MIFLQNLFHLLPKVTLCNSKPRSPRLCLIILNKEYCIRNQETQTYSSSVFATRACDRGIGKADRWHNEHCSHSTVTTVNISKSMQRLNCVVFICYDQITAHHQQISLQQQITQQCTRGASVAQQLVHRIHNLRGNCEPGRK